MDDVYATPLYADLLQSRYDTFQLNRIEAMLSQLVITFTGLGVAPELAMGSTTVEVNDVLEPSQFVPGLTSHTPVSLSISRSKQRRLRAVRTKNQMWSNLHHGAAADSVQAYEAEFSFEEKVADDMKFNSVADRLDDAVSIFLDDDNLQSALAKPICCDEPECYSARVEALVEKFKEKFQDEDIPQYSSKQMHTIIQQVVDLEISQLREIPRWQGVPDDIVADIVAKLKSSYGLADGNLYSRSHARKLVETIGCLCRDAVTPFLATDTSSDT